MIGPCRLGVPSERLLYLFCDYDASLLTFGTQCNPAVPLDLLCGLLPSFWRVSTPSTARLVPCLRLAGCCKQNIVCHNDGCLVVICCAVWRRRCDILKDGSSGGGSWRGIAPPSRDAPRALGSCCRVLSCSDESCDVRVPSPRSCEHACRSQGLLQYFLG